MVPPIDFSIYNFPCENITLWSPLVIFRYSPDLVFGLHRWKIYQNCHKMALNDEEYPKNNVNTKITAKLLKYDDNSS